MRYTFFHAIDDENLRRYIYDHKRANNLLLPKAVYEKFSRISIQVHVKRPNLAILRRSPSQSRLYRLVCAMATIVGKSPAWQTVTLTFVRPADLAGVEWQEARRTLVQTFKFIRDLQTIEIVGFVDNMVETMTQQMMLPEKVEDLYGSSQPILHHTTDALLRHVPTTDAAPTIYRFGMKPLRSHIWGTLMTSADTLRCLEYSLMSLVNYTVLFKLTHGLEPQIAQWRIE